MVNKETYFNDLPEYFKKKIINIRNLGNMRNEKLVMVPLNDFDEVTVSSSKQLYNIGLEILESLKNIQPINVEEKLREEVKQFKNYVSIYNNSLSERNFIGEMDKTIQLLEERYKKLK